MRSPLSPPLCLITVPTTSPPYLHAHQGAAAQTQGGCWTLPHKLDLAQRDGVHLHPGGGEEVWDRYEDVKCGMLRGMALTYAQMGGA